MVVFIWGGFGWCWMWVCGFSVGCFLVVVGRWCNGLLWVGIVVVLG